MDPSSKDKSTLTDEERSATAGRWLEEHGDFLYRRAMSLIGRPEVAEDLVQETLLAAFQNLEDFRRASSERTWLTTILRNKAIDYLRRALRREIPTDFQEPTDADDGHFNSWGIWNDKLEKWRLWSDSPADSLEQKGLRDALQNCLRKLPMTQRSVVFLRAIEGLPIEEVCNQLELSPSNIGVLLFRARLWLRRCLNETWYEKK